MSDDNVVTFQGNKKPSNVVSFPAKEEPELCDECGNALLFVCSACNCRSWRLMSDGTVECCNCDNVVTIEGPDPGKCGWRKITEYAPTDRESVPELEAGNINVRAMGDEDFALRSTIRDVERWQKAGTLMFVGAYKNDGTGCWWIGSRDAETAAWMASKIEDVAKHLRTTHYPVEGGTGETSNEGEAEGREEGDGGSDRSGMAPPSGVLPEKG
jgi:hypothetical protein